MVEGKLERLQCPAWPITACPLMICDNFKRSFLTCLHQRLRIYNKVWPNCAVSRWQLSHHCPTSTWRSASKRQPGLSSGIGLITVNIVGRRVWKEANKQRKKTKRNRCADLRGRRGMRDLEVPWPVEFLASPPPHAWLWSSALHYFVEYLQRRQAWVLFLSLFFTNIFFQMNAYMAAFLIVCYNYFVSTSSYNVPSKNDTSAWKKAQKNNYSITVFCKPFNYVLSGCSLYFVLLYFCPTIFFKMVITYFRKYTHLQIWISRGVELLNVIWVQLKAARRLLLWFSDLQMFLWL